VPWSISASTKTSSHMFSELRFFCFSRFFSFLAFGGGTGSSLPEASSDSVASSLPYVS
jgi:hypothetical protein